MQRTDIGPRWPLLGKGQALLAGVEHLGDSGLVELPQGASQVCPGPGLIVFGPQHRRQRVAAMALPSAGQVGQQSGRLAVADIQRPPSASRWGRPRKCSLSSGTASSYTICPKHTFRPGGGETSDLQPGRNGLAKVLNSTKKHRSGQRSSKKDAPQTQCKRFTNTRLRTVRSSRGPHLVRKGARP